MRLPQDNNGRLKGFGYAEFADKETLLAALTLNNEVTFLAHETKFSGTLIFLTPWEWQGWSPLACENSHYSSLFATGDVSRGITSATWQQKFHTDDVNQCIHYKSSSHGVPNANLFNFMFLLVDFGKVLCSSANKLQQNSDASSRVHCRIYSTNIDCFVIDSSRLHLTIVAFCLLSVIRKQ